MKVKQLTISQLVTDQQAEELTELARHKGITLSLLMTELVSIFIADVTSMEAWGDIDIESDDVLHRFSPTFQLQDVEI
jgi:hypothetical protein